MKFKSPSDSLFASPRASKHLRRAAIATAIFFALASIGCDSPSTENVDQIQHALYAETLGMEVVLTFFPHDEQTRVEILFLGGAAS